MDTNEDFTLTITSWGDDICRGTFSGTLTDSGSSVLITEGSFEAPMGVKF